MNDTLDTILRFIFVFAMIMPWFLGVYAAFCIVILNAPLGINAVINTSIATVMAIVGYLIWCEINE